MARRLARLESAIATAARAVANVSSIDGIVLSRLVEPGQTVTAGFTTPVLFRLAQDLTRMRLNVDIDEADVDHVHEGAEATFTVEAYGPRSFPSKVLSFHTDPKTSQNVVTYEAVLAVDNAERLLRPGMTCTATITAETRRDVLVVPNAALRFVPPKGSGLGNTKKAGVEGRDKQRIWILDARLTPREVPVRAGVSGGLITEIEGDGRDPHAMAIVDVKEPSP